MAMEFNITTADEFFLGEDKIIDFEIFGQDEVTPIDVAGLPLEWSLRLKDNSPDPPLLLKQTAPGTGITIVGVFDDDPALNTQRVRLTFTSDETDPVVTSALADPFIPYTLKAKKAYRHSLKRMDAGNEGIFSYGSFTFLQATER